MKLRYQQIVAEILRQWRADFSLAAKEVANEYEQLIKRLEPDGHVYDERNFYWISENEELEPDTGKRVYTSAELSKVGVGSDRFRGGFRVDADDFLKPGIANLHRRRVQNLGRRPEITKNRFCWRMLLRGYTAEFGLAHDGQEMFSTDHPGKTLAGNDTSYTNLFDLPLTGENFDFIVTAMLEYTDTTGMHAGNTWDAHPDGRPNVEVIAGQKYKSTLLEIFNTTRNEAGASNKYYNTARYRTSPHLVGDFADFWLVRIDSTSGDEDDRPLLFDEPYEPTLIEVVDPASKSVFDLHAVEFGVNARFGAAYWNWMTTALSTGGQAQQLLQAAVAEDRLRDLQEIR